MRLNLRLVSCAAVGLVMGCGGAAFHPPVDNGDLSAKQDSDMAMSLPPDMAGPIGGLSGDSCAADGDCAPGNSPTKKPQCIKAVGTAPDTLTWPGGYCAAVCRMALNDATSGLNPDCPDSNSTCEVDPTTNTWGHCRRACETSADCRTDYACFVVTDNGDLGCEPKAQSECDPRKAKSCPATPPMGDAGPGYNDTCLDAGDDTVGYCYPGCDPLANKGCEQQLDYTDCHASFDTGEGYCFSAPMMSVGAGGDCGYDTDCPSGYGCLGPMAATPGKCWKYCHDDGKTVPAQCGDMAATCSKIDPMSPVATSVVGICTKSN